MEKARLIVIVEEEIMRKKAIIKLLESGDEKTLSKYHQEVIDALSTVLEFYRSKIE